MWELDWKESWVPKNWYFWTVVLEKTLESSLDCREIKPSNPKGNQSWKSFGRTDAEAESPILCHLMWRTDSLEKTLMLGMIEGRRRKGQQRMRRLDGITDLWHEFEQVPGVLMDREGWLTPVLWGHRESDTAEQLKWTELNWRSLHRGTKSDPAF